MYYEMMMRKRATERIQSIVDSKSEPKKWINELEVFTFDKEKRMRLLKKRAEANVQSVYQTLGTVLRTQDGR